MKKIFVSSTFKDMQYERDMLHTKTQVDLGERFKTTHESFMFLDLRWGINTSQESEGERVKEILSVCEKEIQESYPLMIVFIGEKEGSLIPFESSKGFGKTITQFEIETGIHQKNKTLFYFRDSFKNLDDLDKETYLEKDALKKKEIDEYKTNLEKNGALVRHYSLSYSESGEVKGLDELNERIISDIVELLESEEIKGETFKNKHCRIVDNYLEDYVGKGLAYDVKDILHSIKEHTITFLYGPFGMGKTALLGNLYEALKKEVCYFHLASGKKRLLDLVVNMLSYFDYPFPLEEEGDVLFKKLYSFLGERKESIYIFIDDGEYYQDVFDTYPFLEMSIPSNLNFVIASNRKKYYHGNSSLKEINLSLLSDEEKNVFMNHYCKYLHKAPFDEEIILAILRKEKSSFPLYLTLIMNYILLFDKDDFLVINEGGFDFTGYLVNVINHYPVDEREAIKILFEKVIKQIKDSSLEEALLLTSLANVLPLDYYEKLIPNFYYLSFSRCLRLVPSLFITMESEIKYSDFSIKSLVSSLYPMEEKKRLGKKLIQCFEKDIPSFASIQSLPELCIFCDETNVLLRLVKSLHQREEQSFVTKDIVIHYFTNPKTQFIHHLVNDAPKDILSYFIYEFYDSLMESNVSYYQIFEFLSDLLIRIDEMNENERLAFLNRYLKILLLNDQVSRMAIPYEMGKEDAFIEHYYGLFVKIENDIKIPIELLIDEIKWLSEAFKNRRLKDALFYMSKLIEYCVKQFIKRNFDIKQSFMAIETAINCISDGTSLSIHDFINHERMRSSLFELIYFRTGQDYYDQFVEIVEDLKSTNQIDRFTIDETEFLVKLYYLIFLSSKGNPRLYSPSLDQLIFYATSFHQFSQSIHSCFYLAQAYFYKALWLTSIDERKAMEYFRLSFALIGKANDRSDHIYYEEYIIFEKMRIYETNVSSLDQAIKRICSLSLKMVMKEKEDGKMMNSYILRTLLVLLNDSTLFNRNRETILSVLVNAEEIGFQKYAVDDEDIPIIEEILKKSNCYGEAFFNRQKSIFMGE